MGTFNGSGVGKSIRRLIRAIFWTVPLSVCTSSAAQAQENWRCDAQYGQFDDNFLRIRPETRELTGEMVFHRAHLGDRWRPTAKIVFEDSARHPGDCVCTGIRAFVLPDYPDGIEIRMVVDGQEQTPGGRVPYEKPVTFKLTYLEGDAVKLEVGTGVWSAVTSYPQRDQLHLSCSGADVSFINLNPR